MGLLPKKGHSGKLRERPLKGATPGGPVSLPGPKNAGRICASVGIVADQPSSLQRPAHSFSRRLAAMHAR